MLDHPAPVQKRTSPAAAAAAALALPLPAQRTISAAATAYSARLERYVQCSSIRSPEARLELLEYYLKAAAPVRKLNRSVFMRYFYGYVYIRIMQAMGAYGLRGFYEGKTHFLQSVPYAVRNIEWLLRHAEMPVKLPELARIFRAMAASSYLRQFGSTKLGLTVRVSSFSYRKGLPADDKGHGGGFVFDCRFLPNPGREAKYAPLTGRDPEVASFLSGSKEVKSFLEGVYALLDPAVENYQSRNFTDLMVSFGCTGGRHRSVYCAEQFKKHLLEKYKVKAELRHRELDAAGEERRA